MHYSLGNSVLYFSSERMPVLIEYRPSALEAFSERHTCSWKSYLFDQPRVVVGRHSAHEELEMECLSSHLLVLFLPGDGRTLGGKNQVFSLLATAVPGIWLCPYSEHKEHVLSGNPQERKL